MYFRFCLKAQTFLQWNRFSGMFALLWRWIQSRVKVVAISLLLSPYLWAKLFRGVVAIVAAPMRFAMICWVVLEAFVGQIHVFPLGSWMTILYIWFAEVVPAYLAYFWMGGRLIFFSWWFGMKKGCGGAGSCALHVVVKIWPWVLRLTTHESGVVRGVVPGSFGGRSVVRFYFQC